MNIKKFLTNQYQEVPDLIIREINYGNNLVTLFYIETICNSDSINNFILKNLTNYNKKVKLKDILATPNLKEIKKREIDYYLFNGFSIINSGKLFYALETRASLDRSVEKPTIEPDLYGAKDSLLENYQKNIGLIKRRIKSNHLKIKEYNLGKYTLNKTGLLYIDDITQPKYINKCDELINKINTESIIDIGQLNQFIVKEGENFFPKTKLTERPDTVIHALLEGKIVIIMDNSPFALILPAVLADFINPISDNYIHFNNINFLKILRLICLFLTVLAPAYYIATINYNQETIPSKLLTSFITQRQGVPFPATIEAFFMLFICELLRESDLRFPTSYGSSISILGALILGEAAVSASIVSPIMIIIIALTFISSMIFNNIEINSALRVWRFIALFIASLFGLYGVAIATIFLIISLSSYYSFDLSYTFPIAPFDKNYLKNTLIKGKKINDNFRSKYLTKNIRKKRNK